jgi:hypothetical protein
LTRAARALSRLIVGAQAGQQVLLGAGEARFQVGEGFPAVDGGDHAAAAGRGGVRGDPAPGTAPGGSRASELDALQAKVPGVPLTI